MAKKQNELRRISGRTFSGEHLTQIAMPMGGIGAGCICLNGIGGLQDFSIRHKPDTTAMPDGHGFSHAAFALVHVKGKEPLTLLAEGPVPWAWVWARGLQGQGFRKGGHEGLPRFAKCRFVARYPFGQVQLRDPDSPVDVAITGWSPLIPPDDRDSGMPSAILEYTLSNRTKKPVEVEWSYHLSNLATGGGGDSGTRSSLIPGGVHLTNTDPANAETFGSASLTVIGHAPKVKASWFRGGWFDWGSVLWRECSTGTFRESPPTTSAGSGRNGASVLVPLRIKPGRSVTVPVAITWHFPNVHYTHGPKLEAPAPGTASAVGSGTSCCGETGCCPDPGPAPAWKPWYGTQWKDAADVAMDVRNRYDWLRSRTLAFTDSVHGDKRLPPEVIDAAMSNLAILKSPTILRESSGMLWNWEGCFVGSGCCHGSCTHVWNYAQALPYLFPQLERTSREVELRYSMDERGHINFRSALPIRPTDHGWHAAADGQLGGIMKLWRDFAIGQDRDWLASLYPLAKKSLGFCIATWDPDRTGLLVEPHHNTYDIEFWGPDGMCSGIYVGALCAMAKIASEMDEPDYAAECRALAEKGAAAMSGELFNGEYFQQNVRWEDLRDQGFVRKLADTANTDENARIEREEGPKYQYGAGCLSDGVIGSWMATLYGIDTPINARQVRSSLKSIVKYNFRKDLWRHACLQRPGYALGHDSGLILCTWPRGQKLTLPFPYSDEVWTGFEYQVASHLAMEGMKKESLKLVKAARARYDGRTRNPFCEYECGNYYGRALSSWALVRAFATPSSPASVPKHTRKNRGIA